MSIYRFGLEAGDIVDELPIDGSQISATSTPVNTGHLEGWIDDRASMAIGVLAKGGITDVDNLDDATERQVQIYIKAATVSDALDKMGMSTEQGMDRWQQKARTAWQVLANAKLLRKRVTRMRSNVDENATVRRDFVGSDYEF